MDATVLIIETDTSFLQNLAHRLMQHGLKVFAVEDPDEALHIIEKENVEIVLLDLSALKQNGIEALQEIKASRSEVEVLIINTPEQVALSIEAMKQGAFNDLYMPFDMASLIDLIGKARRHQANRVR